MLSGRERLEKIAFIALSALSLSCPHLKQQIYRELCCLLCSAFIFTKLLHATVVQVWIRCTGFTPDLLRFDDRISRYSLRNRWDLYHHFTPLLVRSWKELGQTGIFLVLPQCGLFGVVTGQALPTSLCTSQPCDCWSHQPKNNRVSALFLVGKKLNTMSRFSVFVFS